MTRLPTPAEVRAECAARDARIDAMFFSVESEMARIHALMADDGLLRPADAHTRIGELA